MTATAAVARDDTKAATPKKLVRLHSAGKLVRVQEFARGALMGERNRVLRRKLFAVRHQAVAPGSSSRWDAVADDAPQGFHNIRLCNEFRNHDSLRLPPLTTMMMPVRSSFIMTGTDHCIESHISVALMVRRLHVKLKQRRRVPPVSGRSARATVRRRLAADIGRGNGRRPRRINLLAMWRDGRRQSPGPSGVIGRQDRRRLVPRSRAWNVG